MASGSAGGGMSSTNAQSNSNTAQNVNATGTSTTTRDFSAQQKASLDAIMAGADFTKANAIADSKAASAAAMQNILQQQMPNIASQDKHAGGYDNTTAQLLTDDLVARTAAAGAQTTLNTVKDYASNQSNLVNAAANAVNVTTGTTTNTTGASNTRSQTATTDQSNTGNASILGQAGSVICTQLWLDGHLDEFIYLADNKYAREHLSPHTINGYRFLAVPFVMLMRRNKLAYAIGKYFGLRWSHHCASYYTNRALPNGMIAVISVIGIPICFCIGAVIPDVTYYKLWKGS